MRIRTSLVTYYRYVAFPTKLKRHRMVSVICVLGTSAYALHLVSPFMFEMLESNQLPLAWDQRLMGPPRLPNLPSQFWFSESKTFEHHDIAWSPRHYTAYLRFREPCTFDRIRTYNLRLNRASHYQLCYKGIKTVHDAGADPATYRL